MWEKINPYCTNSFLNFRYLVNKSEYWKSNCQPWWPDKKNNKKVNILSHEELYDFLKITMSNINNNTGILLSGGIDSAILASFMPEGSDAFTLIFKVKGAIDESIQAAKYAQYLNLNHHIVEVEWDDYLEYSKILMKHKNSPLHAIEVPIFKAAKLAKTIGIDSLVVGNGADTTFGGLDKLLSHDWSYKDFIKRYNFIDSRKVLVEPLNLSYTYEAFKTKDGIDVQKFLKEVHGEGIIQTFCNAAQCANVDLIEPFEMVKYALPLDLDRIRSGESKYLLRSLFNRIFPEFEIPEKIPFARPMDKWLGAWQGPQNKLFLKELKLKDFSGDQKWLIYTLNEFLELIQNA